MIKLSIVIPVYFNEENLAPLYADIREKVIDQIDYSYEIILVDDGSGDQSWQVIEKLARENPCVRGIRLSRNFGSHAAILCGLAGARGECAVVKAADLQEPTEMIHEMVQSWEAGNHVVLAVRAGREEAKSQTLFSNLYYWLTRKTCLPNMPKGGFDTFLVDQKVIQMLVQMDEKNSALTGQILWGGFQTDQIYYTRLARTIGKSRWTLKKKLKLISDTLFSFSTMPITFVSYIGAISIFGAVIWGLVVLGLRLFGKIPVSGWTTMFIFNLCSFGITMLTLGILGGYLWRTFDATRNRPVYVIEDETGIQEKEK